MTKASIKTAPAISQESKAQRDREILEACSSQKNKLVLKLVEQGYDINAGASENWTPLIWACETMDSEMTQRLLELGADANASDGVGMSPLHHAGRQNCAASIKALIAHGADLNAVDKDGFTPLHHACIRDHLESALILIQSGADTSIKTNGLGGKTAEQMQSKRLQQHIASALAKEELEGAFQTTPSSRERARKKESLSL